MSLSAKQKLVAARAMIREKNRYFTALVNGLQYHWLPPGMLGTMAITDTGVILLDEQDPVFKQGVEAIAVSILHEGWGHWLQDHRHRKPPGADKKIWNLAGDCEINDDLAKAGWRILPEDMVYPKTYGFEDGLIAEAYYAKLRKMQAEGDPRLQSGGQGQGEGQEGEGQGEGQGDKPQLGGGWCGSGAGRPVPNEPEPEKKGKGQGDKDSKGNGQGQGNAPGGRSDGEKDRIKKAVAESMQKHEKQRGRGTLPGGWSRWADDMLAPPKVDWRQKLNQLVRDAVAYRPGAVVTTWKKFGRRQAALGFGPGKPMVPAWRNPVPNVTVVVDTSGSMGHEELSLAASEIDGILQAVMADVEFVAIDSHVHAVAQIHDVSDLSKHLKGGGGTDFRPAFELLGKPRAGRMPTEVVIFLTDGDGPAPAQCPPGMKVVWVLVGRHARVPYSGGYGGAEVTWGTFIKITSDGEEDLEERSAA